MNMLRMTLHSQSAFRHDSYAKEHVPALFCPWAADLALQLPSTPAAQLGRFPWHGLLELGLWKMSWLEAVGGQHCWAPWMLGVIEVMVAVDLLQPSWRSR